jgi:cold shock CspA family protein
VRGIVQSFSDAEGLGVVRGDDGVEYPFHCVEIEGGTRTIEVGRAVIFRPGTGHQGRDEAYELSPL